MKDYYFSLLFLLLVLACNNDADDLPDPKTIVDVLIVNQDGEDLLDPSTQLEGRIIPSLLKVEVSGNISEDPASSPMAGNDPSIDFFRSDTFRLINPATDGRYRMRLFFNPVYSRSSLILNYGNGLATDTLLANVYRRGNVIDYSGIFLNGEMVYTSDVNTNRTIIITKDD